MTVAIKQLTTQQEWMEAYYVLVQLRTELTVEKYLQLLKEMTQDGYLLFALYENMNIVAVAGLSWRVNFYSERHIFVYDLVTDEKYRSLSYGEILLHYLHKWGKENGAHYIALESGIQRTSAHRFYEDRLGYEKWCFSFRKTL
ncbi:GNAT family N-acetyltransferase [Lysinibacillus sp. NPDC095746]|uniref:GNAT family N-acetyltransferase n=1 Tax=Lysinibacillus sp. NPDC095746 TaxID=3364134 RepID=UPI003825463A